MDVFLYGEWSPQTTKTDAHSTAVFNRCNRKRDVDKSLDHSSKNAISKSQRVERDVALTAMLRSIVSRFF